MALFVSGVMTPLQSAWASCYDQIEFEQVSVEAKRIYERTNGAVQEFIWDLKRNGNLNESRRVRELFEYYLRHQTAFSGETELMGKTKPVRFSTGIGLLAVFKKVRMSNEVLAYKVDKFFGLDVVPITVRADFGGRLGVGVVQLFVRAGELKGGDRMVSASSTS